jgi:hypothetical protein
MSLIRTYYAKEVKTTLVASIQALEERDRESKEVEREKSVEDTLCIYGSILGVSLMAQATQEPQTARAEL